MEYHFEHGVQAFYLCFSQALEAALEELASSLLHARDALKAGLGNTYMGDSAVFRAWCRIDQPVVFHPVNDFGDGRKFGNGVG